MFVWFMFALGYGVIPHEWLTFGNSYLNFDSSSYLSSQQEPRSSRSTSRATRSVDAVAAVIYVVVLGLNIYFFAAWQKRKVAEPATEGETADDRTPAPITGGARVLAASAATKRTVRAYGRPVTTTDVVADGP